MMSVVASWGTASSAFRAVNERRQELLTAVQQGSVVSWRHVNVHGEYDFSDEKLQDSVGLCLPVSLGLLLPHSEDGTEFPASGC